jgi:hypothetical protein
MTVKVDCGRSIKSSPAELRMKIQFRKKIEPSQAGVQTGARMHYNKHKTKQSANQVFISFDQEQLGTMQFGYLEPMGG